jgi:hypothetical protein
MWQSSFDSTFVQIIGSHEAGSKTCAHDPHATQWSGVGG